MPAPFPVLVNVYGVVAVGVAERFPDGAADRTEFLLIPRLPLPELVEVPFHWLPGALGEPPPQRQSRRADEDEGGPAVVEDAEPDGVGLGDGDHEDGYRYTCPQQLPERHPRPGVRGPDRWQPPDPGDQQPEGAAGHEDSRGGESTGSPGRVQHGCQGGCGACEQEDGP